MGKGWIAALILIVLTVGIGVGENEFVLDAQRVVESNPLIDQGSFSEIISSRWWFGEDAVEATLYRPIPTLWFAAVAKVGSGREDPKPFHMGSLILHIVAALARYLLVLLILAGLSHRHLLAFLCALLPALHGVSFESVSCIVGSAELLAAIFVTLSWCSFIAGLRKFGPAHGAFLLFSSAAFWFLALLSKESVIFFPAVLLTQWWVESKTKSERPSLGSLGLTGVLFLAAAGGWWHLRSQALGGFSLDFAGGPFAEFSTVERIRSALAVIGSEYLPSIIFPFELMPNITHQDVPPPSRWMSGAVVLGMVSVLFIVGCFFFTLRHKTRIAPLILFAIVSFLPVSNFIVGIGTVGGFRLLYSPLFGVTAAVILALGMSKRMTSTAKVGFVILGFWSAVATASVFPLIEAWKSSESLAVYAEGINPKSVWALQNRIAAQHTQGRGPSDLKAFCAAFDAFDSIEGELATLPNSDRLDQDSRVIVYRLSMQRAAAEGTYATTLKAKEALEHVQRGISAALKAEEYGWGNADRVFDARLATFRLRLVALDQATRFGIAEERESLIQELEGDVAILDELATKEVAKESRLSFLFEAARYAQLLGKKEVVDYYVARGLAVDQKDMKLTVMRANSLVAEKDFRGAYLAMDPVIQSDEAGIEELYLTAEVCRLLRKKSERQRLLQRAMSLQPRSENEVRLLSRIAVMLKDS